MRYLSLFTGIGGFELGIDQAYEILYQRSAGTQEQEDHSDGNSPHASGEHSWKPPSCVGYSEIDKHAIQTYQKHYPKHKNYGDIKLINEKELPDFDLLVGGFPCQAFSIAGKRKGFEDTRGTLFFDIARILKSKKPRRILLENVKGLLSHDNGDTFKVIITTLTKLGYDIQWQVLNSKNFGVPQNRERVFIVGHLRGTGRPSVFPIELENDNEKQIEKVYLLPSGIPDELAELCVARCEKGLLREQMQELFAFVQQEIQKGECRELQGETESMDSNAEGSVQVTEELDSWAFSLYTAGDIHRVVQIPTKEVLLLWSGRESPSIRFRQVQQQDVPFERGQGGIGEIIRRKQPSPLLFAVQSHQGRLFYSVGDGRNWQNIYQKSLGKTKWKKNSLSSILEERPDPKYFLSSEQQEKILKQGDFTRMTEDGHHRARNDKKKSSIQGTHVTKKSGKSHCLNTNHVPMTE